MTEFRVVIYADGLVLPLIVPVTCGTRNLTEHLQRIFAHDLVATRAEVWDGATLVMQIGKGGIALLVDQARPPEPPPASRALH